jgi:hypothetical protein
VVNIVWIHLLAAALFLSFLECGAAIGMSVTAGGGTIK